MPLPLTPEPAHLAQPSSAGTGGGGPDTGGTGGGGPFGRSPGPVALTGRILNPRDALDS